eukprot:TRINITY_DN827_c0_g1_i1.p1 TRINITY_DN827_c0_g1~~TRINITY_DN827_c0_g1_i1.p1  ORF type:complete len:281 (-),score=43.37 TRINITY_DN827_c0_g1_i1:52-894(-)
MLGLESEEQERLIVSLDPNYKILDHITITGLPPIPSFAKYPYVDLWSFHTMVIIRSPPDFFHIPTQITQYLKPDKMLENVYFTVQRSPTKELNFLPHMWCFPDMLPGVKLGYEDNQYVGIFGFKGCKVETHDTNWNMVEWHQVHIHQQKGGMCFSPNNGRIRVIEDDCVACIWSFIEIGNRVCISLHWLLVGDVDFDPPRTVDELLGFQEGAHIENLKYLITGEGNIGDFDSPPVQSTRKKGNSRKKKRNRGNKSNRGGRGRGNRGNKSNRRDNRNMRVD